MEARVWSHESTRVPAVAALFGGGFSVAWAAQTAAKDPPKLVIAHKVVKKTQNWLRETTHECVLPDA
jgi:hypothetical protein